MSGKPGYDLFEKETLKTLETGDTSDTSDNALNVKILHNMPT